MKDEKSFMPEFPLRAIFVPKSQNKFGMMGVAPASAHQRKKDREKCFSFFTVFFSGAGGGT